MLRDENGEGKIVVVDNSQEFWSCWGQINDFCTNNNWKAIILNGYVRDTDETQK